MSELAETVRGLPNLCGHEDLVESAAMRNRDHAVFAPEGYIDFGRVKSAAAIALHMHQPLIPAGGDVPRHAATISNLKYMFEHQALGDNHNAPVFLHCYRRMGELVPQLVQAGHNPRVMLDYSGTLLHGLWEMGAHDVIETLRGITQEPTYRRCVEWLGCPWGHAVAPSTPVQDYRLHVRAWQHHFAAVFGLEALGRVRGFSPAEMALPNHPDVAYEFVRTLKDCGYDWVIVQEHSVEDPETGRNPTRRHVPHRLVCRSSTGQEASIIAVVKTQGSDTKLIGQMQPYYEALGLERVDLAGKRIPPLVAQIADGENGGVMMNEFPSKYLEVVRECSGSATPLMNVTEYLEQLHSLGLRETDFPVLQPFFQSRIWERMSPGDGPEELAEVVGELRLEDGSFHMEGGSWTNNLSWVRGYDDVLGPMDRVSALFDETIRRVRPSTNEHRYRNALFHLLASQTSCFRYWGQGVWTDYGRELCRRTEDILTYDFQSRAAAAASPAA